MPKEKQSAAGIEQGHGDEKGGIEPLTYYIRPTETAKSLLITIRCCLCNSVMEKDLKGWCGNCQTYPINVTPVRFDERGHAVSTHGWCMQCAAYTMTALDAQPGEWIDTGIVQRRLTRDEVKILAREMATKLEGPGWPDKIVPLRRDMIPRSWKRGPLKVVGQTPLGYDIVLPAGIVEQTDPDGVPF